MTVIDTIAPLASTNEAVPRASNPLAHPAFGAAHRATVAPISLTRYAVSIEGEPIGYLEADGAEWVALSGMNFERTIEVGRHRLLAAALRLLTNPR